MPRQVRGNEGYRTIKDFGRGCGCTPADVAWYLPHGKETILNHVNGVQLAPGAKAAFRRLRRFGIKTALVSISWKFAVEWLGLELGADYAVGTDWLDTDEVGDFRPDDKAVWLASLLAQLGTSPDELVAVGDSTGDIPIATARPARVFCGDDDAGV